MAEVGDVVGRDPADVDPRRAEHRQRPTGYGGRRLGRRRNACPVTRPGRRGAERTTGMVDKPPILRPRATTEIVLSGPRQVGLGGDPAQFGALHLRRRGHRQVVDHPPRRGTLNGDSPARQYSVRAAGSRLASGRRDDEEHHQLAPPIVGQTHDGGAVDVRVRREQLLDLHRGCVSAAGLDHSLSRPTTRQAPSSVHLRQVAGVQPAVGVDRAPPWQPGRRGSHTVEAGAAHPQLTGHPRRHRRLRPARLSGRRCRPAEPRRSPGRSGRMGRCGVCRTAPQVSVMPNVMDSRAPNTASTRSTKDGVHGHAAGEEDRRSAREIGGRQCRGTPRAGRAASGRPTAGSPAGR